MSIPTAYQMRGLILPMGLGFSFLQETLIGTKKWASIIDNYSTAEELSEGMLNACVELIKVHSDGSLEIAFNYMEEFEELLETTKRLRKEVA